jgi:DNA-binding GntR family transcriptional regulator
MAPKSKAAAAAAPAPATSDENILSLWRKYEGDPVAANAIYATLREGILAGILLPGDRLAEPQLAGLFKRSRTPVREAILRLEWERLAERSARRGFVVGGVTREEILEVYAVREVIDALAARLAAQGCLPMELEHIQWLNRRLRKAGEEHDYKLMVELNIEFHEAIARGSRNGLLLQFMRQIHDWVRRFRETTLSYQGRATQAANEHDALLEALANRDPDAAERIAREHMVHARQVRVAMQQSASRES